MKFEKNKVKNSQVIPCNLLFLIVGVFSDRQLKLVFNIERSKPANNRSSNHHLSIYLPICVPRSVLCFSYNKLVS
ncbi:hypothetical protein HanPI659440_Chr04g0148571 [Helianthus annuus]|nr:hypothetical protein HanPI659440_Chr04g0148571 [Helianthus annuus]